MFLNNIKVALFYSIDISVYNCIFKINLFKIFCSHFTLKKLSTNNKLKKICSNYNLKDAIFVFLNLRNTITSVTYNTITLSFLCFNI